VSFLLFAPASLAFLIVWSCSDQSYCTSRLQTACDGCVDVCSPMSLTFDFGADPVIVEGMRIWGDPYGLGSRNWPLFRDACCVLH
jgi:hypothetical protein